MKSPSLIALVCFIVNCHCLSIGKSTEVVHNSSEIDRGPPARERGSPSSNEDNCDITRIPAMDSFDMDEFSGIWYELAKTVAGYIDVDDGMWKIMINNASNERYKFFFSGRDANSHCVRPVPGSVQANSANPGEITFKYRTYSTHVSETFRVLYTDYETYAVLYRCGHVDQHTHKCHAAGILGSIWTRKSHVQHEIFDRAAEVLSRACIDKKTLRIRLEKGPCVVDDLGMQDEIPQAPNFCTLPVSPGSCQANLKRFYYSEYTRDCHEFEFSGCGGNKNNFFSKNDCANMCMEISSKDTSCRETAPCALGCPPCCTEKADGCVKCSCESIIVDHFANCFRDNLQCPDECVPEEKYPECFICVCEEQNYPEPVNKIAPVCLETMDKGKCNDREERFYFNVFSERCEKFNYTGCGGTKNNFVNLEQCKKNCKVSGTEMKLEAPVRLDDDGPDGANIMSSTSLSIFLSVLLSVLWARQ